MPLPERRDTMLYNCILIASEERERVQDFLLGSALSGQTEGIRYRLWTTLETGVLCLALPLKEDAPICSPESISVARFCPVDSRAVKHEVLSRVELQAALIRRMAQASGIVLPDESLFYVSDKAGEVILSLKCESDSPAFDQRIWLVRVLSDLGWAWQGWNLNGQPTEAPLIYPKFAWKDVAPSPPPLLQSIQS
jgi:hypothetical protein